MDKPVIAGALIALGLASSPHARPAAPYLQFKEEMMTLRYAPGANQAVIVVEAESEVTLDRLQVVSPTGQAVINVRGGNASFGLSGFELETGESDAVSLFTTYPEGMYNLRGRTVTGETVLGSAMLIHELLPAPAILHPLEGAINVPTSNLEVQWTPDPAADGYRVVLEQDENDGLTVKLPAGTGSFRVPDGLLAPGKRTQLEVLAIGPNGNCTQAEVFFRTL